MPVCFSGGYGHQSVPNRTTARFAFEMPPPLLLVRIVGPLAGFLILALRPLPAQKPGVSMEELQKLLQNPIAQKISFSYTNEFDYGPRSDSKTAYLGTFQPVIPFTVGAVSFISRPALSFTRVQSEETGQSFRGLGDLGYQLFLTPAKTRTIIFGAGPAFVFPTATREGFGNGKWTAGPTAAMVVQPGRLSLAVAVTNLWSYAGNHKRAHTNQLSLEYAVDYELGSGWSLATNPVITDDWRGAAGEHWSVPVGGGISKAYNGRVPVEFSMLAYRNVTRPSFASSWSLQIKVTPVLALK
jgi:hypothetical protein